MKRKILLLSTVILMSLVGCGKNNPSESGSSDITISDDGTISVTDSNESSSSLDLSDNGLLTFDETLDILERAAAQEALYSSSANVKKTQFMGDISYISEETYEMFDDYSSFSQGIISRREEGKDDESDTFVRRSMVVTDKIEDNGEVYSYPMFAQITDYTDDVIDNNSYRDSASKVYIVNSEEDAINGGLSSSSYILASQYPVQSSAKVAYDALIFTASNIAESIYVSQLGKQTFSYIKTEESFTLSFNANYSYNGDWDDGDTIYSVINVELKFSSDLSQLLKANYTYTMDDVASSDPDDHYLTGYTIESSVTFDEREAVREGITNANDYFLAKAEDVEIIASMDGNRVTIDADSIPANASYLWGKAKAYSPSLATNLDLISYGSSNEDVIEFDNGYFYVKSTGIATLSFLYYEKGDDGVYRKTIIEKEVTIVTPEATGISFSYNYDVEDNTLLKDKTYIWGTYVSPSKADQRITASSSDTSILEVSVNEDNDLVILAKEVGEATITITSVANPSLSAKKTLKVMNGDQDFNSIISSKTYGFLYSWAGQQQYTFTMTFDGSGHGTRVQYVFDTGKTYVDEFDYTIEENVISFSNWTEGAPHQYETGTILDNGNSISCYDPVYYGTDVFKAE